MNFSSYRPAIGRSEQVSQPFDIFSNADLIFEEAIHDCHQLLQSRQQIVSVSNYKLWPYGAMPNGALAGLLAKAIGDISSLSCRGGVLTLGTVGTDIVIQSHHPLDIPPDALPVNERLRLAGMRLRVRVAMAWEQGRGPRLTLSLPPADTSSAGGFAASGPA